MFYLVWGHFETEGLNLLGNLRKCAQPPLPHPRSAPSRAVSFASLRPSG